MNRLYGLIGFPLSHSFSEKYFKEKFKREKLKNVSYHNFPLPEISRLLPLIEAEKSLHGLNVTIPYKEEVMKYLDKTDSVAAEVGAVNTIKIFQTTGSFNLAGYNTDVYGFEKSLLEHFNLTGCRALILGSGGASKAVKYVLEKLNIPVTLVSRKSKGTDIIGYQEITPEIIKYNRLIVNTTPLGMYPDIDSFPSLPYDHLSESHMLFDLVYNPPLSRFLEKGKLAGAGILNGLKMLEYQAERSWQIWTSEEGHPF